MTKSLFKRASEELLTLNQDIDLLLYVKRYTSHQKLTKYNRGIL